MKITEHRQYTFVFPKEKVLSGVEMSKNVLFSKLLLCANKQILITILILTD